MAAIFRYSGNKTRMIKYLPAPPEGTKIIIEPFSGSLAYSLHYRPELVFGAEASNELRELWRWLIKDATEEDVRAIEKLKALDKVDVRTLNLPLAQETLLRLQTSGAYVGQLSSWILYPQHSLVLDKLVAALPYIKKSISPLYEDYTEATLEKVSRHPNALAVVDPPYLETSGNYSRKGKDHNHMVAEDVTAFIKRLACPVLLTYGNKAAETFPEFNWQVACVRKVPILRGGGTRERTEHFAKIGF